MKTWIGGYLVMLVILILCKVITGRPWALAPIGAGPMNMGGPVNIVRAQRQLAIIQQEERQHETINQ